MLPLVTWLPGDPRNIVLAAPGARPVTAVIAGWFATLITTLALHEITLYVRSPGDGGLIHGANLASE